MFVLYVVVSLAETDLSIWFDWETHFWVFVIISISIVVVSYIVPEPFPQQLFYPLVAKLWQNADNNQL